MWPRLVNQGGTHCALFSVLLLPACHDRCSLLQDDCAERMLLKISNVPRHRCILPTSSKRDTGSNHSHFSYTHLCCMMGCTRFMSAWGGAGVMPLPASALLTDGLRLWAGPMLGGSSPLPTRPDPVASDAWLADLLRPRSKLQQKSVR